MASRQVLGLLQRRLVLQSCLGVRDLASGLPKGVSIAGLSLPAVNRSSSPVRPAKIQSHSDRNSPIGQAPSGRNTPVELTPSRKPTSSRRHGVYESSSNVQEFLRICLENPGVLVIGRDHDYIDADVFSTIARNSGSRYFMKRSVKFIRDFVNAEKIERRRRGQDLDIFELPVHASFF